MLRRLTALLGALALGTAALFARGGGGCLAAGTLIATPHGEVPIESLRAGDAVWSVRDGRRVAARVEAVFAVEPDEFVELTTADGAVLRATPEHPVQVAPGVFVRADRLVAERVSVSRQRVEGNALHLAAVRRVPADRAAYNLLVAPGGVFFANGVLVHNKGCFLPDTPILLADGSRVPLRDVHADAVVLAFDATGRTVPARVAAVLTHEVQSYLVVRTTGMELRVTEEHPFYAGAGVFKTAEALRPGDIIWAHDGHGALAPQALLALKRVRAPATVYNLRTDEPHTFFADGIAVHNKGGGGGGGGGFHSRSGGSSFRSGGSGSGTDMPGWLVLLIVGGFIALWIYGATHQQKDDDEELDYCFSRHDIEGKAAKTRELLAFIAKVDARWAAAELQAIARNVFTKLQACWAARDYAAMEPLLLRDLYEQHCAQLRGLRETHEINQMEELAIAAVDIVHVRYTDKQDERTFTALITASARDIYLDDRTREFIRGDAEPAQFQEFWTFQLADGAFRLREIEQTKESDALTEENFFAPFTDQGRDQIYGQTAGTSGPAGPALPAAVLAKDNKIERLLNFLVQTDKIWNRDEMLATARRVYTSVLLGWQDGRPEAFTGVALAPELAAHLRAVNETNRTQGARVEFRNFCVRKLEIVHVNNVDDRAQDAFTVRVSAHAQTIIAQGGREVRHDPYVRAWVDFWTFGRDDRRWVLKEILPEASGESALARENVDEGTGQQMLEWYYSKPRAN